MKIVGNKPKLHELSKEEFNMLKNIGMLWEFYPEAPEFWEDIQKMSANE